MHRNAPLTPEGRMRLCHRIQSGWSITAAAESMQISGKPPPSGGAGLYVREPLALSIGPAGPGAAPGVPSPSSKRRSSGCAPHASWARHALVGSLGSLHRPCTASWCATVSIDCVGWIGRQAGLFAASRPHGRASSSTSMSKGSPASRMAAGTSCSGTCRGAPTRRPALATPTSTRPSMPTRAWPTRSSPGLRTHPTAWRSSSVRWTALPITASRSSASSPTMATATAADCGQAHAIEWASPTPAPSPTTRRPTAKQSAITARCSTRCFYVCQAAVDCELPSKKRNNCRATVRFRQRLISRAERPSAWRRAT